VDEGDGGCWRIGRFQHRRLMAFFILSNLASSTLSDTCTPRDWESQRMCLRQFDCSRLWASPVKRGEYEKALKLLDESITEAIRENQVSWVRTLSHHAAVISKFAGNLQLVKHYYEQSLAFNPDNPRALYGLAEVAREQGETEIARQYAVRCHKAIEESEDETVKQALLELLVKHWPEVAGE
jgi:tetratricopeptide (TPR) repeat protein